MIRGRGLLATALKNSDSDEYLFYANGISNSVASEIPENNFEFREITGLAEIHKDKIFVYFSTSQVNAKENFKRPYVQHKYKIESLTKQLFSNYIIVRTSNLVGNNPWNDHTLFNFLYNSLKGGVEINVMESISRNILDVDHFITLLNYYIRSPNSINTTIDIVNPVSFNMAEILNEFEKVFAMEFKKNNIENNIAHFQAPVAFSLSLVNNCHIELDNYLSTVIKKYYLK